MLFPLDHFTFYFTMTVVFCPLFSHIVLCHFLNRLFLVYIMKFYVLNSFHILMLSLVQQLVLLLRDCFSWCFSGGGYRSSYILHAIFQITCRQKGKLDYFRLFVILKIKKYVQNRFEIVCSLVGSVARNKQALSQTTFN